MSTKAKTAEPGGTEPEALAPGEVLAYHAAYGDRSFSALTWAAMTDREGTRDGWELKVAKPAELA